MASYHLTDEGNAGLCRAKQGRCPFGTSRDHFDSAEQAREYYEAGQSMGDLMAQAMRANPSTRAMQELIDRNEAFRRQLIRAYADSPEVEEEFYGASIEQLETHNRLYHAYDEVLSEDERKALYDYAGIAYDPINEYLREPEQFAAKTRPDSDFDREAWARRQIELLDGALAKAPPVQRRVFRRLDQLTLNDLISSEDWAGQLGFVEGETVEFQSYSSTSSDPGYIARTARHDPHTAVVLVIDTDRGAPVGPTAIDRTRTYSTQEAEVEILLPRNASFKVTEVKRTGFKDETYGRIEVLTVFLRQA